jgi:XTP/dITP diphosphohydrolase
MFEETCNGVLTHDPRGIRGFGYDPAFVPVEIDDGRTMAELAEDEKDAISHRGKAARAFRDWLQAQEAAA